MNESKTRLFKNGYRQEVTGLVVNEKVNVTRKYIRQLRFFLFKWQTEGYAKAYAKFYAIYKREKGYIKKGEPVMENVIGGKLDYLKMVKGEQDSTYVTLKQLYDKLQQVVFVDTETDEKHRYVYVQPYTVPEFEEQFKTTLKLEVSKQQKIFARCKLFGKDITISVSKNSQIPICPTIDTYQPGNTVFSDVLKDCYVTLCQQRGRQLKYFWLITCNAPNRSKCLSLQNIHFDKNAIDELLATWEKDGLEKAVELFNDAINGGDLLKEKINTPKDVRNIDNGEEVHSHTDIKMKKENEKENESLLKKLANFNLDKNRFEELRNFI